MSYHLLFVRIAVRFFILGWIFLSGCNGSNNSTSQDGTVVFVDGDGSLIADGTINNPMILSEAIAVDADVVIN